MRIKDIFRKKSRKLPRHSKRGFSAASINRLTLNWATSITSSDAEIRQDLRKLRARARVLSVNNDYARKYLKMCRANVVGHQGIGLQMRVVQEVNSTTGEIIYDEGANRIIEEKWYEWGRKKNCTIDGKLSWIDVQQNVIEAVAKDGEILIRKLRGRIADNPFGFTLQLLEADHLDENHNEDLRNGNYIRMGIEYNEWAKPVAYHIFNRHPGDTMASSLGKTERTRVPASDIIHLFHPERASQSRGFPWMVSAMTRINMLGGYEEAELVAARVGASKMGFFKSGDGEQYQGEGEDGEGGVITEAEPGIFEQLPDGMDFVEFNPDHPTTAFGDFIKTVLRGAASGLGVSYNNLANDLEGVNFSSLRQGNLWERDMWRLLQTWLTEHLHDDIFEDWLLMALTTKEIGLPVSKIEKFNKPVWRPRGWMWVDPVKEVKSNLEAISGGLKSAQDVASEQGNDIEDVYAQLAAEEKLREKYGIKLPANEKQNNTVVEEVENEEEPA